MAKIFLKCKKCGSSQLNVRSSVQITGNTVKTSAYCTSCQTQHELITEIVKVRIPLFQESVEALAANKPLNEIDPNQSDLPLGDNE